MEEKKPKQYLTARRKHHVIYRTTCKVTGRYYIGMHSTDKLDDGYLGSGKRLWQSIRKHGIENHVYEIIEHLPSRELLRAREAELVNEEMIGDSMCMNIALGGGGGWEYVEGVRNFKRPEVQAKLRGLYVAARNANPELAKQWDEKARLGHQAYLAAGVSPKLLETMSSVEYKLLQSQISKERWTNERKASVSGAKNASSGRPWIYHADRKECKKIDPQLLEAYLQEGWIKGRKFLT